MGYGDLSLTGATEYKTPNLDKMANQGMFFTPLLFTSGCLQRIESRASYRLLSKQDRYYRSFKSQVKYWYIR